MRKLFYPHLALSNLNKNRRTYFPYILTCIGTILMFYNACALTFHPAIHGPTQSMMYLGTVVTAIFSAVFLFYTNSFLVKRRKKEFGLFNILGMEKRHIGKIMMWESIFVAAISIVIGLALGVLFSKLITLLLYKLLQFDPKFTFEISAEALGISVGLFVCIFILILLSSLWQVYATKPVDLLKGGNIGEKEPKTKWFITILGVLTLGGGYAIAWTVKDPIAAIPLFFLAVILVIIGTYSLFTAGSIALLKGLKRNKRYYYQTKHFTAVSGMIYRMKQNAVGLANICIMSTAVLVMISTTVSMYVGVEDLLALRYPKDFSITVNYAPDENVDVKAVSDEISAKFAREGRERSNLSEYSYLSFAAMRSGNRYSAREVNFIETTDDMTMLVLLTAKNYQKLTGTELHLQEGEAAVYAERAMAQIDLAGRTYQVTKQLAQEPHMGELIAYMVDRVYVILPTDSDMLLLYNEQLQAYGYHASSMDYEISFDFETMSDAEIQQFTNELMEDIGHKFTEISFSYESKQLNKAGFFELYGGLFFLGIFLGALFLLATVLIIYYKQVVEGFEDKERFLIMQKVGMSHEEVKKSIRSQILTVFALPILVAAVHILAAFPILVKLLALLSLTNVTLFAVCTVATMLVFVIIYAIVYMLTARVYYKIVNE